MEHLTITDKYFLEVLREKNYIHSFVLRAEPMSVAYMKCLELLLMEPPEEWIREHLAELAKDAEELLREYILNWKKDSFLSPYRQIVQEFYEFSDDEMAEIAEERGFI